MNWDLQGPQTASDLIFVWLISRRKLVHQFQRLATLPRGPSATEHEPIKRLTQVQFQWQQLNLPQTTAAVGDTALQTNNSAGFAAKGRGSILGNCPKVVEKFSSEIAAVAAAASATLPVSCALRTRPSRAKSQLRNPVTLCTFRCTRPG